MSAVISIAENHVSLSALYISGLAVSPRIDRSGDIIEPDGITAAPDGIPLLLRHDPKQIIGIARLLPPDQGGVRFEATLPHTSEPGPLRERIQEAIRLIQDRRLTAVSIGFNPIDGAFETMAGGGIRYRQIEIVELSLVAVGINPLAKIDTIKSGSSSERAALSRCLARPR